MTMSHKVYSVRGIEITNYSEYPVEWDVRELFGFGQPLDYQGGLKQPGVLTWGWGAAITMVADALGVEFDEIRETCEFRPPPATCIHRLRARPGRRRRGHLRQVIGVIDGQEVVSLEHVDRMADDLAPDWPTGRTGATDGVWRVPSTANPRSMANSRSATARAKAPATTGCWPPVCARSTPSRGCVKQRPGSSTPCIYP